MHVWTIASARDTIGGPSFESRTPCNAALFHWSTTLSEAETSAATGTVWSARSCADAGSLSPHATSPPPASATRMPTTVNRASTADLLEVEGDVGAGLALALRDPHRHATLGAPVLAGATDHGEAQTLVHHLAEKAGAVEHDV